MKLLVIALAFVSATCSAGAEDPKPVVDNGTIHRACERLRELGCEDGEPTPEGATCEQVIENAAKNGIDLVGDIECLERATTCDAAAEC